jgi:dihydroorotase
VPFGEATPGSSALETLLPLTLKWSEEANVPLPLALAKVTCEPARLLGHDTGRLAIGAPADICIFNPQAFWAVTAETLMSQGKNTPWLRRELQGRVSHTLVGGEVVFTA